MGTWWTFALSVCFYFSSSLERPPSSAKSQLPRGVAVTPSSQTMNDLLLITCALSTSMHPMLMNF